MRIGTISLYEPTEILKTDKFVYFLKAIHAMPHKKFPRKIKTFKIGYFESHEAGETYLQKYCLIGQRGKEWDKSLHHFEIEKLPLNAELMEPLGYWIYLKNGNLFQEYPDVEAPFLGVKESDRKFHEKEIVELMAYGKLELAIIISYPLTPEEIEYRKKRAIEKFNFAHENDFTDYFFFAIIYKDGVTAENIKETNHEYLYDHNHGLNIFPLSYPVSTEQKKTLENLYELYGS